MLRKVAHTLVKTQQQIQKMRAACRLAANTLEMIAKHVKLGVTTNQLDKLCHDFIISHGGRPACLGYKGYPKTVCTSLNHVVCHGIPNNKPLKNGDIFNLDLVVELDGYHGDTSRMFMVGQPSIIAKRLIKATQKAMYIGIQQVKPGEPLDNIGNAIDAFLSSYNYSVVRDFSGHGIGVSMHEKPDVVHFKNANSGVIMQAGMTFTIEPMVNVGGYRTKIMKDGWTAVTKDRSLSAQFEHTILVTDTGYEILTLRNDQSEGDLLLTSA